MVDVGNVCLLVLGWSGTGCNGKRVIDIFSRDRQQN